MRLALVVFLMTAPFAQAADWPQWLGPERDGSSTETVAPWKGALKTVWKEPVGEGHSSPVIAGGKVYLFFKVKDKNEEQLEAFDAATGKRLWQKSYDRGNFKSLFGNGPRATPTVTGGKVYTFGITGILTCFDADKGDQLWQVDTLKQYGAKNLFFGASCSPLVEEDRALLNVGGKGASIVAFDKNSGKELWKVLDDKASYSSPIAIGKGTERQAVFLTAEGLVAVSPKDGKVFWQSAFKDALSESSTTPVFTGGMVIGSSITLGTLGLKWDGDKVTRQWVNDELTCYFSTPIGVGGTHLYLVTGTKPPALNIQAKLHCLELRTGRTMWTRKDKVGNYHASLLRTGDNKLLLLEEGGDLVLVDPDPKEYRELARAKICGHTWAHPALSNGRLYVRDDKELVCVELK